MLTWLFATLVASIHKLELPEYQVLEVLAACCLPQLLGHPQQKKNKIRIKSSQVCYIASAFLVWGIISKILTVKLWRFIYPFGGAVPRCSGWRTWLLTQGSVVQFPHSTSHLDETLNRGPLLHITFLCWWDVKPSSFTHYDLDVIQGFINMCMDLLRIVFKNSKISVEGCNV